VPPLPKFTLDRSARLQNGPAQSAHVFNGRLRLTQPAVANVIRLRCRALRSRDSLAALVRFRPAWDSANNFHLVIDGWRLKTTGGSEMLRSAAILTVVVVVSAGSGSSRAQNAPCDPTAALAPEQTSRRNVAIGVARRINTAQAQAASSLKRYAQLGELGNISIPQGFDVQVSADPSGYTFSVKDLQDACKFAVFSDQAGVIYAGNPIR
jgi:hypothetical protein